MLSADTTKKILHYFVFASKCISFKLRTETKEKKYIFTIKQFLVTNLHMTNLKINK